MKIKNIFTTIVIISSKTFFLIGCADSIITECQTDTLQNIETLVNFSDIQKEVFNQSCALAGCHTGANPQAGLNLSSNSAYSNLVDVQSALYPQFKRVEPGNSGNSLLVKTLTGEVPTRMPPSGNINPELIEKIKNWIDQGAINN